MAFNQSVRGGSKAERSKAARSAAAKMPGSPEIPDKLYFRIGEVAKLCNVAPYVLRFWEGEFPQLKPNKGGTGQRLYRRRDVEMALRVKTLLHDEGYTIAGARQLLKAEARSKGPQQVVAIETSVAESDAQKIQRLKAEMQTLLAMLGQPTSTKTKGASVQSIRAVKPRPAPMRPVVAGLFDNIE